MVLRSGKYIFFIAIIFLFSCGRKINKTKAPGTYLLYSHKFKGAKDFSSLDLDPYLKQRSNYKFLGLRLSMHFYKLGEKYYSREELRREIDSTTIYYNKKIIEAQHDSLKVVKLSAKKDKRIKKLNRKLEDGNWVMRNLGSPPVVFDTMLTAQSANTLKLFLKTKGYFHAKVEYEVDTTFNAIFLKYNIDQGERFKFGKITFSVKDGLVKRLINEHLEESLLKEGDFYDEMLLVSERDRIDKLCRNNGYFDFLKRYVTIDLDSGNYQVAVKMNVDNQENGEPHKIYKVNKLIMNIDQTKEADPDDFFSRNYQDILFNYSERRYSSKVLYNKMNIYPGDKYSFGNSQLTQRNINQLEMFRFVNITYEKDSTGNGLTGKIETSSTDKYQLSDEIGFSVSQGLPGPFGSLTFIARNVFNGCEIFDINVRGGIEGVASATRKDRFYQSQEVSASTGLTFPRLFTIVNLNQIFKNNNPRTKLQGSYNFIFRPEYKRSNTRVSLTYYLSKNLFHQYSLAIADINYIQTPFLDAQFRDYLEIQRLRGNNLFISFMPTVATNMNFAYSFNNFVLGENKRATYFKIYTESGGTTLNFLPPSVIDFAKKRFALNSIFIYWKVLLDARRYIPVTRGSSLATRFSIGFANPYGGSRELPYEKYFFSGGSNSIRAWLPRRLGPGSYSGNADYRIEQPGLVQLEMNLEYRFKIIKFFHGALFADAGNVWRLNDSNPQRNLKLSSFNEIAVGSGIGFRFDFSFLIVRLDGGVKMWDPAQPLNERWVANKINFLDPSDIFRKSTWNIAVGYPF